MRRRRHGWGAARFRSGAPAAVLMTVALIAVLGGCDSLVLEQFLDEEDVTAPVPGGPITVSNITFNFFDIFWPEADDDWTPTEDLEYAAFGSQFDEIETLAEAEVYAEYYSGWQRGYTFIGSDEFPGAVDGLRYYINVFVRDSEGNTASYGQIEVTPPPRYDIFVRGPGDVPRVYRNYSEYGGPIAFSFDDVVYLGNFGVDGPVAIADLVENGLLDLVQGQAGAGNPVRTYINNGEWSDNGLVSLQELSGTAGEFEDIADFVALAEFNGDGFRDLLTIDTTPGNGVVSLNTFGQFSSVPIPQTDPVWNAPTFSVASAVDVADVDFDGFDDVILGRNGFPAIVFRNIGSGSFETATTFGGGATQELIVEPITVGDDIPDVLQIYSSSIRLDIGTGDAYTFLWHSASEIATLNLRCGTVADFDGDGDLDLAVGRLETAEIAVYLNAGISEDPASGFWVESSSSIDLPGVSDAADLAAADLDGDGDPDLVAISELDQVLMVWSNEGSVPDSDVTFVGAFGFPVSLSSFVPKQLEVVPLVP